MLTKHQRDRLAKAAKPRNPMLTDLLFRTGKGKHGKTTSQTRSNDKVKLRKEYDNG
jgi:hypothetical protein